MTADELAAKLGILDPPTFGLLEAALCERLPQETVLQSAERILLFEALLRTDNVAQRASELLGISQRVINYKLQALGWRPIDLQEKASK